MSFRFFIQCYSHTYNNLFFFIYFIAITIASSPSSVTVTEGDLTGQLLLTIPVTGVTGAASYTAHGNLFFTLPYFTVSGDNTQVNVTGNANIKYEKLGPKIDPTFGGGVFTIVIVGSDSAGGTSSVSVRININNDNECSFGITESVLTIVEQMNDANMDVETVETTIRYPGRIEFAINTTRTDPKVAQKFEVAPLTGLVSLKAGAIVDYEELNSMVLYIDCIVGTQATTVYGDKSVFTLNIEVQDINDNSNVFGTSSYPFSVDENAVNGDVIGQVSATDADNSTANAATYYYIGGNLFSNLFTINITTGEIMSTGNLDYEAGTMYSLTVCATDNATSSNQLVPLSNIRTSCVPVTISLNDVNDNEPLFSHENYTITVSEKVPVGRDIFTFQATDADSGVNGQFEYKVVSMESALFSLDSGTGAVNVIAALNYEQATNHTIVIYAEDKGKI